MSELSSAALEGAAEVVLVAMPFALVNVPSIQIGTLTSVLARAGIAAQPLSLHLAFARHLADAGLDLGDYQRLAYGPDAIIEWVFAVPPFRPASPEDDAAYLAQLRAERPEDAALIELAARARAEVPAFLDHWTERILALGPVVVGLTTTFVQTIPALALAHRLKARAPGTAIVLGGGNCDGPMGEALHRTYPFVDVVVRGDAERVAPALFADLLARRPVTGQPGLCVRDGAGARVWPQEGSALPAMEEVPPPDYGEYFARLEASGLGDTLGPLVEIPFESARGCWWGERSHCMFCGLNGTAMKYRSKSADRTAGELVALAQRHHHLRFRAVDNIIDLGYIDALLPRLTAAGWDFELFYETKANLKKPQLRAMRDAGLRRIQPGLETLSTPIARLMSKGVTALQNIRLLKWSAELGIDVAWNVIYGIPGEPPAEYERMAALVPRLVHLASPILCLLALERFSPYHADPGAYGLEIVGAGGGRNRYVYPDADPATLLELAHSFRYRHTAGPSPTSYIEPLRAAIDAWAVRKAAGATLSHARGPGFLVITDRRHGERGATYSLDEAEAAIYLACDAGATPTQIGERLAIDAGEVREFLDELVAEGLVYAEQGKYLALSTAQTPRARGADARGELVGEILGDDGDAGERDVGDAAKLVQLGGRRAS
ncbi:MAG TPA: RiPP maturation radical SAM C-methyltransferase [Kofleriaceae bacterium]|nr:RiPP maturation radical SAM C-methyltransferase [Kofleriaceae bacterium]